MVSGVSFKLLSEPEIVIPHLTGNLLPSVREFLSQTMAQLEIATTRVTKPRRQNDIIIMDHVLKQGWSTAEIKSINQMRLYFQIKTLSEMTMANGLKILESVLDFRGVHNSRSTLQWSCQDRPDKEGKTAWNKFIQTFTTNSLFEFNLCLGQRSKNM